MDYENREELSEELIEKGTGGNSHGNKKRMIVIIALVVLALIAGIFFLTQNNKNNKTTVQEYTYVLNYYNNGELFCVSSYGPTTDESHIFNVTGEKPDSEKFIGWSLNNENENTVNGNEEVKITCNNPTLDLYAIYIVTEEEKDNNDTEIKNPVETKENNGIKKPENKPVKKDAVNTVPEYVYTPTQQQETTYVVTFNANGGEVTTTNKNVTSGATYGTMPTPTRTNYIFKGWYTEATGGNKVETTTKATITAAQTLYAHWGTDSPGLYVTGSETQFAKITLSGSQVDATWENIKAAYPDAFTDANTIKANGFISCFEPLSGDLVISNEITSICDSAFAYCTNLTSITIPDGVTTLDNRAFRGCTNLTSITIPNGVTSIGQETFYECQSLTSINVSASNTNYSSENGILFNKNKTALICYPAGKTETNYVIPNSVTSINYGAFRDCANLTSITIPNTLTTIESWAFTNCTGLTSITIPDSVTSIGQFTFNGCTGLTSITIPNRVTTIGDCAFTHCTSLTSITIPDSVTSIGDSAFSHCENLQFITISNNTTSINNNTFNNCKNLTSITIPNGVTSIGDGAFIGCQKLTSIIIPNGVLHIGNNIVNGCTSLTSITIPNSVITMEDYSIDKNDIVITYNGTQAQWDTIKNKNGDSLNIIDGIVVNCTASEISMATPTSIPPSGSES